MVKVEVLALHRCLLLGGLSTDGENDLLSSAEEGEHNVEIMLCSFAHLACSPLLQGFPHEEELCGM